MKQPSLVLACHFSYGETSQLSFVKMTDSGFEALSVPLGPESEKPQHQKPLYIHAELDKIYCFDPVLKQINTLTALPKDSPAGYAYHDPKQNWAWIVNDGDKETGTDHMNCGEHGSSVSVFNTSSTPTFVKTICLGKGHHVCCFVPADPTNQIRACVYISNLMDGSISVVNNEPSSHTYLEVVNRISLADVKRDENGSEGIPNQSFPHGMVYSQLSHKVYSLNNGYETIAVINPATHVIENVIESPQSSNLLIHPNGRYIVSKGVDRDSDPDHLTGILSVLDVVTGTRLQTLRLPDIYPSTYKFNLEGSQLFLTTASSGKAKQKQNARVELLLIFDVLADGSLLQSHTLTLGRADCSRRPIALVASGKTTKWIVHPNLTDGSLSILDATTLQTLQTLAVAKGNAKEVAFSFWNTSFFGT